MLVRAAPLSHRKLSWLLWLALLLPMAQAAAKWHGYSHVSNWASQGDESQVPQLDHCELCLAAASVSAGALPSVARTLPDSIRRHEKPHLLAIGVWPAHSALGYRSRAPPATLR